MAEAKKTTKVAKTTAKKEIKDGDLKKNNPTKSRPDNSKEIAPTKVASKTTEKVAKAGKRSTKAIKESEEKAVKEARKTQPAESTPTVIAKTQQKPTRTRLERRSKAYKKLAEQINKDTEYSLKQALDVATKTSSVKFDATVELHINLNVDPRQADQNIRGSIVLPSGTGKTSKITVIADVDDAKKAKAAGADDAGNDEIFAKLDKGTIDFDILIATPAMMAKLGKYARVLGPKGLMPNPKSGTVTTDVVKAVKEAKGGRVEYRVDSTGIVHLGVGKVSFGVDKLLPNAEAVLSSIRSSKPSSIKGIFVKSVFVTTSMGPSIKVAQTSAQ